jgi:hypothetical protein
VVSRATGGSDATDLTTDELDQLADFVAGAADPAVEARIARRVADEPRWAAAHRQLVAADTAMSELLRASAQPLVMPADVAAGVDDALRVLARSSGLSLITGEASDPPPTISAPERLRHWRIGRIAAAAAGIVAVVGGIGLAAKSINDSGSTTASAPMRDNSGAAPAQGPSLGGPEPERLFSGTNYTSQTLSGAPKRLVSPDFASVPGVEPPQVPERADGAAAVPDPLVRLLDPGALAACLDAIRALIPGTVTTVDYAKFEGDPALVVVVRRAGQLTNVAVGPDCGRIGADQKAIAPAG